MEGSFVMYGKIHDTIYEGTLAEDWRALITFQQMLILCDADGNIDMTPRAISRRTGIPIDHIEAGIKVLEAPDPESRSSNEQGRRIIRLDDHRDWGWFIVNHAEYRAIKNAQDRREYKTRKQREYREKNSKENKDVVDKSVHKCPPSVSVSVICSKYNKVSPDIWDEFVQHRKEIRKPLTELSAGKAQKILNELSVDEQRDVVDKSIASRWAGLFPDSKNKISKKNGTGIPHYKDEAALTAFGKKHNILPKAGENYFKYAQRLAVEVKL